MVGQQVLWDEAERLAKLARKKPSLERLKAAIPWQEFRPLLESAFAKERKSPAGRKRIDVIVMFRILGTSKNWAKPSSEMPSHHEKASPGAGFVWTSQLCQGGGRQFFEVPLIIKSTLFM